MNKNFLCWIGIHKWRFINKGQGCEIYKCINCKKFKGL